MGAIVERQFTPRTDAMRHESTYGWAEPIGGIMYKSGSSHGIFFQLSLPEIAFEATITSAILSLYPSATTSSSYLRTINIRRLAVYSADLTNDPVPSGIDGTIRTYTPTTWNSGTRVQIDITDTIQDFVNARNPATQKLTIQLYLASYNSHHYLLHYHSDVGTFSYRPHYSVSFVGDADGPKGARGKNTRNSGIRPSALRRVA